MHNTKCHHRVLEEVQSKQSFALYLCIKNIAFFWHLAPISQLFVCNLEHSTPINHQGKNKHDFSWAKGECDSGMINPFIPKLYLEIKVKNIIYIKY